MAATTTTCFAFLRGLNEAQLQVATHRGSPLLVFAAAGTGKTQALTARIAHLVAHDDVPPEKILALTFTRKAAGEMRQRAATMCNIDEVRLKNVGTFHSLCVRILRKYWPEAVDRRSGSRINNKFTILEPEQVDRIIEETLMDSLEAALRSQRSHCTASERRGPRHQQDLEDALKVAVVRKRIDVWRNRGLEPDDAQVILESAESLVGRVAIEVYSAFRRVCARRNVVDFGDLILHACRVLERVPGALEDCRANAYSHLLVDEFQDTNEAQMRLVRILLGCGSGGGSRARIEKRLSMDELMVVGDDYQAIHTWRGATVRNILDFTKEFPSARTVCLSLNYRSVPSILDAARRVIARNVDQRHKHLVATRRSDSAEDVVVVMNPESPQEEAERIADRIMVACPAMKPSDFAILYRSNAHSQPLEQALRTRGIPYRLMGGAMSFFERSEIKDVMAYARLLLNPRSDHDFERAIQVPHRGIGEKTMEHLREKVDDCSAFDCMMDAARSESSSAGCPKNRREALSAFVDLFRRAPHHNENKHDPEGKDLRELLHAAGYLAMIKAYPTHGGASPKDRYENVVALLDLAERDPDRPLRDFIDACATLDSSTSAADEESEAEGGGGSVSLMTIHASKGLEFDQVYVTGFTEGSLPHALSVMESKIEEERRLCYVAITRAKNRLVLCVPKTRVRFGRAEATIASRFLAEAGLVSP